MKFVLTEIVELLDAKKQGFKYVAKCPAHHDKTPSLHITEKNGTVLFKCFSGCSQVSVIASINKLRGFKPSKKDSEGSKMVKKFSPPMSYNGQKYSKQWEYISPSGEVLGYVVRYDGEDSAKSVIPFFSPGYKIGALKGSKTPLYNAQKIADAHTLIIVEGEKTAEAAESIDGVTAITWQGGANAYQKAEWDLVKNSTAKIYLLPDNDAPGREAMKGIKRLIGRGVILEPNDLCLVGKGDDLADLKVLPSLEDLDALANMVPIEEPAKTEPIKEATPKEETKTEETKLIVTLDKVLDTLNDRHNARRFYYQEKNKAYYVPTHGWMLFKEERDLWERDEQLAVSKMIQAVENISIEIDSLEKRGELKAAETMKKFMRISGNNSKILAALNLARSERMTKSIADFDSNIHLFKVSNGLLDLSKEHLGSFYQDSKKYLITKKTDVSFNAAADCPLWSNFIDEITVGDKELASYLQRAIGYSLTGSNSEQKMFLLWGVGSNGKSVFLETLKTLFGDYARNTSTELILLNKMGDSGESNLVARLQGARMVIGSEIPSGAKLNESRVKEMTGQDTITARHLYKEAFDFQPQFKMWIRSNYRPEIDGKDVGIWRRISLIPFDAEIAPEKRDKNLQTKLLEELPGILNWAILGLQDYYENGLSEPVRIQRANETYRDDMDDFGEWLKNCTCQERLSMVRSKELYDHYITWTTENGDGLKISKKKFSNWLRDRGFMRIKKPHAIYYKGISLIGENSLN